MSQAITFDETLRRRMMDRFLRYVQVDTQSDEDSTASPSTEKQKNLARMLADELRELGCSDVELTEWGYVYATVPATMPAGESAPTIGLIAHVDTYAGTPGGGVKPQVIDAYRGGDIELPGDASQTIRADDNPNLAHCVGHTIVTSDGTTLLGADDKAGVAEIMTVAEWLLAHPDFAHGPVRIGFTTDEEVGRGTEHFDVEAFGADYAYTLDGADLGEIEDETFCADTATVTVTGHDVHPGYGKNRLVNAVRVAAAIVEGLPEQFLPETTEKRQPYLHPYTVSGDVSKVQMKVLVRAFTEDELHAREEALREVVTTVATRFPAADIGVQIEESYRNMAEKIKEDPTVLDIAVEATRRQRIEPIRQAIRGGTDGARLSFMGLLTPNVWAGGQNFHSVQEWVSLDWMAKAAETAVQILTLWAERGRA